MALSDLLNGFGRAGGPSRVLIVGQGILVDELLNGFIPMCASPIYRCTLPGVLALPQVDSGTLVLRDVSMLTASQQHELREWLDHRDLQVVSITSTPLYVQVRQGSFDESLYYRLNVVLEDLTGALTVPSAARHSDP